MGRLFICLLVVFVYVTSAGARLSPFFPAIVYDFNVDHTSFERYGGNGQEGTVEPDYLTWRKVREKKMEMALAENNPQKTLPPLTRPSPSPPPPHPIHRIHHFQSYTMIPIFSSRDAQPIVEKAVKDTLLFPLPPLPPPSSVSATFLFG